MKNRMTLPALLVLAAASLAAAQDAVPPDAPAPEASREFRYSLAVIDDATVYSNLSVPIPKLFNQLLIEPTFAVRYEKRWTFSTSLVGTADTSADSSAGTPAETPTQLRVKETYGGLSAGDFDFTAGRKMVAGARAMLSRQPAFWTRRASPPTPPIA
jgi:hypothetical protein